MLAGYYHIMPLLKNNEFTDSSLLSSYLYLEKSDGQVQDCVVLFLTFSADSPNYHCNFLQIIVYEGMFFRSYYWSFQVTLCKGLLVLPFSYIGEEYVDLTTLPEHFSFTHK